MQRFKQVILVRKDLKMRRGKEIAQGSHASLAFLSQPMLSVLNERGERAIVLDLSAEVETWMREGCAKICLKVHSEEELLGYHQKAQEQGLRSYLIQDSGKTEFDGVPTFTACAIGPNLVEEIDCLTGTLVLY